MNALSSIIISLQEIWLTKSTSKAEKDIIHGFRLKRNYLKAQVRACRLLIRISE